MNQSNLIFVLRRCFGTVYTTGPRLKPAICISAQRFNLNDCQDLNTSRSFSSMQPMIGFAQISVQTNLIAKRFKKTKKSNKVTEENDKDDEDEDDEDESGENPLLMEDDGSNDDGCQQLDIDVNSLRLDSFGKTAFQMTRSKIEELFYKGDIYVNGERPPKKSYDLSVGDEIDLIKQINPEEHEMVDIKRVQIIKIPDKSSQQGRMKVNVKRWQNLTIKPEYEQNE